MSSNPLPEYSSKALSLKLGRYRHFKDASKEYECLGIARHSETLEELVVYKALYGDGDTWVRPLLSFLSEVDTPEGRRPRFEFLGKS
jgi:hypothetical protein